VSGAVHELSLYSCRKKSLTFFAYILKTEVMNDEEKPDKILKTIDMQTRSNELELVILQ
jgi:hypothetical protein